MQTSPQAQAATAVAPAPAATAAGPGTIRILGADGKTLTLAIPQTEAQVAALRARREELSNQLISVSARRESLSDQINETGNTIVRAGLEDRLRLLDQRILQLETDIAQTGQQVSAASPELISATEEPTAPPRGDGFEDGLMVGGGSVLGFAVVVWFIGRRRWRRPGAKRSAQLGEDSSQRLERLEHGMDAIAIEIERISEGQRFVTKLLSESQQSVPSEQRR